MEKLVFVKRTTDSEDTFPFEFESKEKIKEIFEATLKDEKEKYDDFLKWRESFGSLTRETHSRFVEECIKRYPKRVPNSFFVFLGIWLPVEISQSEYFFYTLDEWFEENKISI